MSILTEQQWSDIGINLIATAIAFPVEVLITLLIVNKAITYYDDKRWRPARRNVAQKVYDAHRMLFNAAYRVIDPNFHVNKIDHEFPASTSQEEADYWGKTVFIKPLNSQLTALKKAVEYNNAALDSSILPLVSDFLVAAEELNANINFFVEAYNPKLKNPHTAFAPVKEILRMEEIYNQMLNMFPEVNQGHSFTILSADQLNSVYEDAANRNPRIQFVKAQNTG